MTARTCRSCGTFLHASYFTEPRAGACRSCVADRAANKRQATIRKQAGGIRGERNRTGYHPRPIDQLNVVAAEWVRAA